MAEIILCPGPSYLVFAAPAAPAWCFCCCKRLDGTWKLYEDPPERQPSYYEAVWTRECSGCGENHMDFPGSRDGPPVPPEDVWEASRVVLRPPDD